MSGLTEKQEKVLKFIIKFKNDWQYCPSTREIQENFGWSSQTAAVGHLKALEAKGYIKRNYRAQRAISVLKEPPVFS